MDEEAFKQLCATDQVSCNGVTGLVLGVSKDGAKIHFDGDRGTAVLSSKDLGQVSELRLVRKGTSMQFSDPTPRSVRGYYTRTDRP